MRRSALALCLFLGLVGGVHAGPMQFIQGPVVEPGPERKFRNSKGVIVTALPMMIGGVDFHDTGPTQAGGASYAGIVYADAIQQKRAEGTALNFFWKSSSSILNVKNPCLYHSGFTGNAYNQAEVIDLFGKMDSVSADAGFYTVWIYSRNNLGETAYTESHINYLPMFGLGGVKIKFTDELNRPISGTFLVQLSGNHQPDTTPALSGGTGTDGFMTLGDLRSGKRYTARCTVSSTGQRVDIAFTVPTPSSTADGSPGPHPWVVYEVHTVGVDATPQVAYLGLQGSDPPGEDGGSYDGPKGDAPFFTSEFWVNLVKSLFVPSNSSVEEWRQLTGQMASWGPLGLVNGIKTAWGGPGQEQPKVEAHTFKAGGADIGFSLDWRTTAEGGTWVGDLRATMRSVLGLSVWGLFFLTGFQKYVRPVMNI